MNLKERVLLIKEQIAEVKYKFGICRDIKIVAASKYASVREIGELRDAGIDCAGENRVQDFLTKYEALKGLREEPEWHFIGRLQTNKVKYIIGKAALIQSVDRLNLAEEIRKECNKTGRKANILIEVNVSGEESKGGVPARDAAEFTKKLRDMSELNVLGLMSVMPYEENPEKNRKFYLQTAELYDKINMMEFDGKLKYLSMGMSGDYETAVSCGANMIRLGRILWQNSTM